MARDRWTKLYDLATASPAIAFFSLAAAGSTQQALHEGGVTIAAAAAAANALFAVILVLLLLVRRVPVGWPQGWKPRAAGLVGGVAPIAMFALPRATLSSTAATYVDLIMLVGTLASMAIVLRLGDCFSILPQARGVATTGPYRYIRHPLYLAEFVVIFGLMWRFEMPWGALAFVCAILAQLPRMHYEEQVLSATFGEYRDYARRTARLVPGVY